MNSEESYNKNNYQLAKNNNSNETIGNKTIDNDVKKKNNLDKKIITAESIIDSFNAGEPIDKKIFLPMIRGDTKIRSWIQDHDALIVEFDGKFIAFQDEKDVIKKFEKIFCRADGTNAFQFHNKPITACINVHGTGSYVRNYKYIYEDVIDAGNEKKLMFLPTNIAHGWVASRIDGIYKRVDKQSKIINKIMAYVYEKGRENNCYIETSTQGCSYGNLPAVLYSKSLVENVKDAHIDNINITYPARSFAIHQSIDDIVSVLDSIKPEAIKKIKNIIVTGDVAQSFIQETAHPPVNTQELAINIAKLNKFNVIENILNNENQESIVRCSLDRNFQDLSEKPELNVLLLIAITIFTLGIGSYFYYHRYNQQIKRYKIEKAINNSTARLNMNVRESRWK